jgi:hypothetical protein
MVVREEPDFWVPYEGGHLPMAITGMDVTIDGGLDELRSVEMTIRAVSCGAPIYTTPPAATPKELS